MKGVRAFAAVGADRHAYRKRRAVLARPQRAQIVGDALRQHRYDAVGKINRIAAAGGLAIKRRAWPHVMRHVGDGDADDMAAAVARIGVGYSVDSVVVVLGVGRIDGDEGHIAPVLAQILMPPERGGAGGICFFNRRARKNVGNVVGMDGDQADGAFALDRSEPFHDGRDRNTEPAVTCNLDGDEVAVHRACGCARRNRQFAAKLLLVDRHQAPAAAGNAAKDAEHAVLGAIDELDDAAARLLIVGAFDAQQRAIADTGGFAGPRATRRSDANDRRGAVRRFVPFGRPRQELAVGVAAGNVGEHHGRQGAGVMQPFAVAVDLTLVGQFAQHAV